ncbi:MAG: phosphatidate cytidylyltransferase [Alphaproteobacteria bacterium]|jgi:phosphatidate cytidylyltransferase|nr:phosphatidate cytidylyltransferase [Alphaproteobacteria bacterium]
MNIIAESGGMAPPAAEPASSQLGRRVLSALVLAPVAIGLIYLGSWPFAAAVALTAVIMAVEWERLTGAANAAMAAAQATVLVLAIVLANLALPAPAIAVALGGALLLGFVARTRGRDARWLVLGSLWFALPCIGLVWLRARPELGMELVLGVFLVVWACDTGAYFAGRAIGGPKLAPRWSPKKTWSGLAGGMISAAVVGVLWAGWTGAAPLLLLGIAGALLAVVAQLGDLAESAVKRRFDAKDSGHLIPGHGGLLDRVDGLLFAVPAAALVTLIGGRGVV